MAKKISPFLILLWNPTIRLCSVNCMGAVQWESATKANQLTTMLSSLALYLSRHSLSFVPCWLPISNTIRTFITKNITKAKHYLGKSCKSLFHHSVRRPDVQEWNELIFSTKKADEDDVDHISDVCLFHGIFHHVEHQQVL